MIIAIDGPAASGKSTTARMVAERLGFTYIDSGAMYRAITLKAIREGVDVEDEVKVAELAKNAIIEFRMVDDHQKVFLDGEDVTEDIRLPEVSRKISPVASNPQVREIMVQQQRSIASGKDVVMDGRDIGTVVFPDADVKIYLVASVEERARRRWRELKQKGIVADMNQIREDILRRDHADQNREVGPLKKAADAIEIDTSELTIEQQVEKIIALIRQKFPDKGNEDENKKNNPVK